MTGTGKQDSKSNIRTGGGGTVNTKTDIRGVNPWHTEMSGHDYEHRRGRETNQASQGEGAAVNADADTRKFDFSACAKEAAGGRLGLRTPMGREKNRPSGEGAAVNTDADARDVGRSGIGVHKRGGTRL